MKSVPLQFLAALVATSMVAALFAHRGLPPDVDTIQAFWDRDPTQVKRGIRWGVVGVNEFRFHNWTSEAQELLTPLHCTAITNDVESARWLVAHGAEVNTQAPGGSAPLIYAACYTSADVAEVLLAQGADVNARGYGGETALQRAAGSRCERIVQLLLARRADVTPKDSNGWTALHWGVCNGYSGVIERLLAAGADVNARNDEGLTPFQMAIRRNDRATSDLLRRHGAKE